MSAEAECGRAVRSFRIHVDHIGRVHGHKKRLPEHARFISDGTDGLGTCNIDCDGRVVMLTWQELKLAKERLLNGARLVAWLSRPSGLYR